MHWMCAGKTSRNIHASNYIILLSNHLCIIILQDIPKLETTEFWKQMAPSGKGCVQLYTSMITDGAGE